VNEIQELSANFTWRHVNSENNSSDLVSRGCMPKDVESVSLWWNGPQYLYSVECNPHEKFSQADPISFDETTLEFKPETSNFMSTSSNIFQSFILRFSIFPRLVNSMAYIFRFIHNRSPSNTEKKPVHLQHKKPKRHF